MSASFDATGAPSSPEPSSKSFSGPSPESSLEPSAQSFSGRPPEPSSEPSPETRSALEIAAHPTHHPAFDRLVATIAALRAYDGCPWDKEQTHTSIAHNMIEEAYEALDAIESGDVFHMREELGDVLLQVVLQSQIALDAQEFDIEEVCEAINEKIIRRHPHIFGQENAKDAAAVLDLWDRVKLAEKEQDRTKASDDGHVAGLLDSIPTSLPALMQAQKISRKAAAVGFEWDSVESVWNKVYEEIGELCEAYAAAPKDGTGKVCLHSGDGSKDILAQAVELELGDVLFSLVNVARGMGLDSETALRTSCTKFRNRWSFMEKVAQSENFLLGDLSTEDIEALWERAKRDEDT